MTNQIATFVQQNIDFIGVPFNSPSADFESTTPTDATGPINTNKHSVRVLDYACGPGTKTSILFPYATEFIGMDLSQNMVNAYNRRFSAPSPTITTTTTSHTTTSIDDNDNAASKPKQGASAKAIVADLIAVPKPIGPVTTPECSNFDLVVVCLGFHHMKHLGLATKRLVERLKDGGVLLIIDFVAHSHMETDAKGKNTVAHHGFGPGGVRMMMEDSDVADYEGKVFDEMIDFGADDGGKGGQERKIFMARGRRPVGWKAPV